MTESEGAGKLPYSLAFFTLFAIYGVATPYLQLILRGLGYGPAQVGLFLGLFEVVGIAGPLLMSRAADAKGAFKPFLYACALLVCIPLASLVGDNRIGVTTLSLVVLAFGLRSMVPLLDASAVTMVAANKGWEYGKLRALGSAGFVAMALALQLIPGFDSGPPGHIALVIGGAAAVFALSIIPLPEAGKMRRESRPRASALEPAPAGRGFNRALFGLGLAVIALGRLASAPVGSFFSIYLVEEVKWNAVGGMWALGAFAEIPLMVLSGGIVARLGPMKANMVGTIAIALRLAAYALFPNPAGAIGGQLLNSLCYGLIHPAGVAFVASVVPPEKRAQGMAAYMGLAVGLPTVLGSSLGGFIAEAWGYRLLFAAFIIFALASIGLYLAKRRAFATT